jgi:pimeloyl-ACP methyl ester carboxylesterase
MPFLDGSESRLHYEQFGSGPDVVWISGGGDAGSRWHRYQIPFFETEFRNTTFDNRGVGRTTSEAPLPWTLDAFARDTAELIEAACEPPVGIVGLSMGALIAQELAIARPDLVPCAVVMGTGAGRSSKASWMRPTVTSCGASGTTAPSVDRRLRSSA